MRLGLDGLGVVLDRLTGLARLGEGQAKLETDLRLVAALESQGLLQVGDGLPVALELVQRLAERGYQHLYIDGGKTIQGFIKEGLIQKIIITKVPILIGSGISLFGTLPYDIRLRHLETHHFDNGFVQSRYEVL